MKNKACLLITLSILIKLVLLTSFTTGLLQSSTTISISGTVQSTPTEPYSYIIKISGSNYQMSDGTTKQILFESINSSQVFSNVIGNCSIGSCINVETGIYTITTPWTMQNIDNITLNFENDTLLKAANNLNAPVFYINGANNCYITGINIDGNAVNQVTTDSGGYTPTETDGILISRFSSNNCVDRASITNCGLMGFRVGDGASTSNGIANSLITYCGWNGIGFGLNTYNSYSENNEVAYCGDVGISSYGNLNIISNNYVHNMNGTNGSINSQWGIAVEGGSNCLIRRNTINNVKVGISITNSGFSVCGPASNNTIYENVVTNTDGGISLQSSYNTLNNNQLTNAGDVGIWLDNATFNTLINNNISYCNYAGIVLTSTSTNNTLSLNNIFDNTAFGIDIFSNYNYITENQVYSDGDCSQWIGILMEPNTVNNTITTNNLYGNTNCQINDINVPQNTIINNFGYNPVGYIQNPISGNTGYLVDSGTNSTWISGKIYTNSGSPKVLSISGGTVSSVTQNGVILFTMTNCIVTLQPGDTFSVIFSTKPVINVNGQ